MNHYYTYHVVTNTGEIIANGEGRYSRIKAMDSACNGGQQHGPHAARVKVWLARVRGLEPTVVQTGKYDTKLECTEAEHKSHEEHGRPILKKTAQLWLDERLDQLGINIDNLPTIVQAKLHLLIQSGDNASPSKGIWEFVKKEPEGMETLELIFDNILK